MSCVPISFLKCTLFTPFFSFSLYLCDFIQVAAESKDAPGDFAVFVPYPYLGPVAEALKGSKVCEL